jgi:hypothetical protein
MFRAWAATLATPYYDTVNKSVSPTDPIWSTAQFDPATNTKTTFCADAEEEGQIELIYSSQPGTGDDAVLQAAEADIAAMAAKVDPAGRFVLTGNDPPEDATFGDADTTYRVSVMFTYVFYH